MIDPKVTSIRQSFRVFFMPKYTVTTLFKKLIIILLIVLSWTNTVFAQKAVNLENIQAGNAYLLKKIAIYQVLQRYGSPLTSESDAFINACMQYEIDCYLLPSITGLESGFGKHLLPASYNPFGWGGGYIIFESWEEGFLTVAKGLKYNYIERGLTTPELIAPVYAPPSTTWGQKVRYFMNQFQQAEAETKLPVILRL